MTPETSLTETVRFAAVHAGQYTDIGSAARHGFARLVEARNAFMHPRGVSWYASPETLVRGLPVAVRGVRHLILTQPVVPDLVSPVDQASIADDLESLDALIEFLS